MPQGLPPVPLRGQHRHASVNLTREFGVVPRSENRAGARVRVEQREVIRGETELPARIAELTEVADEESQPCFLHRGALARDSQRAKLEGVMDSREQKIFILKAEQCGKLAVAHQIAEKTFGGVISRDASGQDDARSSARAEQAADGFGEDGIRIDTPHCR